MTSIDLSISLQIRKDKNQFLYNTPQSDSGKNIPEKKASVPPRSKGFRETSSKATGRFAGNVPSLSSKQRDILLPESGHFCGNVPCPHPFQKASELGCALYLLRNGFYFRENPIGSGQRKPVLCGILFSNLQTLPSTSKPRRGVSNMPLASTQKRRHISLWDMPPFLFVFLLTKPIQRQHGQALLL